MFLSNGLNNYTELHIKQDESINFFAIICLHQFGRGPALGGCRFIEYSSTEEAIQDAIRLSNAMSYKAAMSDLPHDGGKAVIIKPRGIHNRELFLNRFSEFVQSLNGKYITTVDSGTCQSDMSIIKRNTSYVIGDFRNEENNPACSTALGVFKGIEAGVKIKYGSDSLKGLHVAIQGLGSVGYQLAKLLFASGVKLTVCDLNEDYTKRCEQEFNASIVSTEEIYEVKCDVFSPCALGRVLTTVSVQKLKASIVAGAANDQLLSENIAEDLHQKNILFIPDYVINAGGLIHLSLEMQNQDKRNIENTVLQIFDRILMLADQAKIHKKSMYSAARSLAENILFANRLQFH